MKVIKATYEDIERLRPVALQWQKTCNGKDMKIDIDIETHLVDLASLIASDDADLFLLLKDNEPIGYMGVKCFKSPLGNQLIANEHYLYVSSKFRGFSTLQLIRQARKWAKEKGCSHIIFNASKLASDMHDKVCCFYKRIGMKRFETSFIEVL